MTEHTIHCADMSCGEELSPGVFQVICTATGQPIKGNKCIDRPEFELCRRGKPANCLIDSMVYFAKINDASEAKGKPNIVKRCRGKRASDRDRDIQRGLTEEQMNDPNQGHWHYWCESEILVWDIHMGCIQVAPKPQYYLMQELSHIERTTDLLFLDCEVRQDIFIRMYPRCDTPDGGDMIIGMLQTHSVVHMMGGWTKIAKEFYRTISEEWRIEREGA